MPRRPLVIILITAGYVVSPFLILLQGAFIHHLSLFGPGGILSRLYFTDIIVLSLYPVSAVAVFSVKKWGWYLFIGCALALLAYNGYVFSLSPRYNVVFLLLYNLAIAFVAGVFFRRHVIAPYFNPRLRWWETEPRYRIEVYGEMEAEGKRLRVELLDISTGGCFGSLKTRLRLGDSYRMSLHCMQQEVEITGKLLRIVTLEGGLLGCGFMFMNKTGEQEKALHGILTTLERGNLRNWDREALQERRAGDAATRGQVKTPSRYLVTHSVHLLTDGVRIPCTIADISKNGCFIRTEHELSQGAPCTLSLQCLKNELTLRGVVKRKDELEGLFGYGISFAAVSGPLRKKLNHLLQTLRRIGAINRLKTAARVSDRVIDEAVRDTPYRAVTFMGRLLRSMRR
jgi:c-di-GMP-binding flagellar brake protein YcgR